MRIWRKLIAVAVSATFVSTTLSSTSSAWGLKTHFWIGQQILNDIADDGKVNLAGRLYEISPTIRDALLASPDKFRMGNLGPDVFPDPIVGQTTTHPGLKHGWKTDEWLRHVLEEAKTPEDIAMAYGFISHAAGDVFAHSYVNAYAGDIFLLTDGERDVERRHFVLEKYIEALTPLPADSTGAIIDWKSNIGANADFLRDSLILGKQVSRQNSKEGSGVHLTAMYDVRHAVENVDRETQKIIADITDFGAGFFKEQIKLQIDLASGKVALDGAEVGLKAAQELLKVKRQIYETAQDALRAANDIVQKNPNLITAQNKILTEQVKIAVDATAEAAKVANDVGQLIGGLEGQITGLANRLAGLVCKTILGDIVPKCDDIRKEINRIRDRISLSRATRDALQKAADIAEKNRDGTKRLLDKLQMEFENAAKGLADGTYKATIATAELELKLQENTIKESQKALAKAQEIHDRITKNLKKVTDVVDEIKKTIDKYNLISLLVKNWLGDIDQSSGEYIKASHRAGEKMLLNSGNPLSEYKEWLSCFGPVFMAHPIEVGELTCKVKNFVQDIQTKFDEAIEGLPEILQWLLFPAQTAKKKAMEKLEPELEKAQFALIKFVTDKTTADFLDLLSNPENATREKLVSVYAEDESGKNLLKFGNVASLVDADLSISNGNLSPEKFAPLEHSLTLAKLALLQPSELNRLIKDLGGNYNSKIYGPDVYPTTGANYSLLFDAIQSIDGNHQWQAYGLPYPRRIGIQQKPPKDTQYGHNYWQDHSKGFRIWVDPYLREKVFLRLFPTPVLGSLRDRPELQSSHYGFPDCLANPFPQTQDQITGALLQSDKACENAGDPNTALVAISTTSPEEYRDRYFQCNVPLLGNRHWTIVGSFRLESNARSQAKQIDATYPDVSAEVWEPVEKEGYWRVMMAGCTTKDRADEARNLAVRRGIATDAFVREVAAPWVPSKE